MNNLLRRFILCAASFFIFAMTPNLSYGYDPHSTQLYHVASEKCAVPLGRKAQEGRTVVVTSDYCLSPFYGAQPLRFTYDESHKVVAHLNSNWCLMPGEIDSNGRSKNGTEIVLGNCNSSFAKFTLQRGKYLHHTASRKCIHLKTGNVANAGDNTRMILQDGCLGESLEWQFTAPGRDTKPPAGAKMTKLVHSLTGYCAATNHARKAADVLRLDNTFVKLYPDDCAFNRQSLNFLLLRNGAILHTMSGKCLRPFRILSDIQDNTALVLHDGCTHEIARFVLRRSGVLEHLYSGFCVRPQGARVEPRPGTQLVLHKDCKRGKAIAFEFLEDE